MSENIPTITYAYAQLEKSIYAALETYSNVHRGSGPASVVSTRLYEMARTSVLNHLGLKQKDYQVIFCSPLRASKLTAAMKADDYQMISSADIGLNLGVTALAVKQNALPKDIPAITGGGTTQLYGPDWVMWAKAPTDRFEAGTPAIINCIAFAKALMIIRQLGKDAFTKEDTQAGTVDDILYTDALQQLSGMKLLEAVRQEWIGSKLLVPTLKGMSSYINLDNSASTPAFETVWQAFRKACHQPSEVQKALLAETKAIVSQFFGAPQDQFDVIFTSNTTESINLLADSINAGNRKQPDDKESIILGSLLEHSSNDLPWRGINKHKLMRLNVDKAGKYDLKALENLLQNHNGNADSKASIRLVALSGASNITGFCNDIGAIGKLTKRFGAQLMVDAAQLAAHRKIDMQSSNIDYLAFSGHKMYAPFGTGALIVRKGLLNFDDQELISIQASGNENIGGIAALAKALLLIKQIGFETIEAEEYKLLHKALSGLASIPEIKIHGYPDSKESEIEHHTAVIPFEIKNNLNSSLAKKLAGHGGIGSRFGCHCAHLFIKYLLDFTPAQDKIQRFVLKIVPILNLQGLLRVSFGLQNTENDVDVMLHSLQQKGKMSSKKYKEFLKQRIALVYG
ncbi:MAG: aminotransferase class V-fold PLP-dependent enzyme [Bacteroidales bacterium]|nr:aminotransferase class V-fold PLP-dependent enzyme [Bacteroidales bacterium]